MAGRSDTYRLNVLQTNGSVDATVDYGLGCIHADTDGSVVLRLHTKVARESIRTRRMKR